jgi:hypothetical protein
MLATERLQAYDWREVLGMADESKVKAGLARAQALSPEQRQNIARKAAISRWTADWPRATHDGDVRIADAVIYAAVLPNGKHILSQGQFLQAVGRSRTPKAGTGAYSTVDGLPFFLQGERLKPFISDELRLSTTPIFFLNKSGQQRRVGYDAELLPKVCEVYLQLRDQSLAKTGHVPKQYQHIIKACDVLMRGLARVGIIALIDEATGFHRDRDREALQELLEKFLRKNLAAWVKVFPDEFYRQIYRLRGWEWHGMSKNRYSVVALWTRDLVYDRLTPGLLKELDKRDPKDKTGRRRGTFTQLLTDEVGHPALAQHLYALIGFQRASSTWKGFYSSVNRAFPRFGNSFKLPFNEEGEPISHERLS